MSNQTYRLIEGNYTWEQVIGTVLQHPAHTDIVVHKTMIPPLPDYFTERMADADGQKADYGASLEDKRGIHVKEYDEHYKVHWDRRDPNVDPLGHLYHDAFHWVIIIGVILAVVLGIGLAYLAYRKKK
ncbi:MAG TPA: hypothetical protein VFJ23_07400 [Candidatus Nitrosotalea sp.]|nr:hypothetical protein [Candidatus Nitrosotalea sp.]